MVSAGHPKNIDNLQSFLQSGQLTHIKQALVLIKEIAVILYEVHKNNFCFGTFKLESIFPDEQVIYK